MSKKNKMTTSDAARIQSASAKVNAGGTAKSSFPAKAQSAAAKNLLTPTPAVKLDK